jgi:hypothetical protein
MAENYGDVMGAIADVSERLVEYTSVWRKAIERNARSEYKADDFLVDLQSLWGMSVRDAARISSALLAACTPGDAGTNQTAASQATAAKKQARKTTAKKQSGRKAARTPTKRPGRQAR